MPLVNLPPAEQPRLSIIVLAWRQTDRLLECLAAVRDSVGTPSFEVVLVLNGASAEVRTLVEAEITGAVVVDVAANVGFGGGCNLGVARARGSLLFFLNDDAVVEPQLLARLVERADSDTGVAAVAAVLVNPDGTLQEAGSRVLSSAGTVQLGAGLPMDSDEAAALLTPRDIDYGSAAALLVDRRAFDAVGGFDPLYEPAYFEDVDLSLRLKEAGWRVVLEPAARAGHAAGSSTSADTRFRRFAADHAGTEFIARWAAVLPAAADRDAGPEALLPVPRAERPPARTSADSPAATAASIASNYSEWLAARLDDLEAEHTRREDELVAELAAARAESRELREKVASLNTVAHDLKLRLDDLEARGPVGVVKWQLGLVKSRRSRGPQD